MPTDFIYLGSRKGISKNTNKEYYVVVGYWFDKDSLVHAQEFFVTSEIYDNLAGVKALAKIKVLLAWYADKKGNFSNHLVQVL